MCIRDRLETARRELAEETGLCDVELLEAPAFEERYRFTKRSGRAVEKTVSYFLGRVGGGGADAVAIQAEEIQDFAWGDAGQTEARLTFPEGRALLREVLDYLGANPAAVGL